MVAIKAEKAAGVGNRVLGVFQTFNASRQAGSMGEAEDRRQWCAPGGGDETQIMI